ncbi:polysaccharide biosynthesis/export family protein [Ovoidimarina sediminis]|uniref:polysaccharide biosynthesis/export family protein n=1 Tax=Ovoidimarina sediminis TaxID=3079856 RepID=UPI00291372C3|nr:polysaccharide biosynthesis/export family protein [Rhodophyticola sp. MJ-SS7]MDU8942577.1 polysaccharide biosynthesis/export family protein [Rhodophyticola sp. MJ-SS7]
MLTRFLMICAAVVFATTAYAQSGYRIQSGDQLTIEVLEDPSLNRQVLVLPDGSVSFPLVGGIRAGGKSTDQFRQDLASALAPNFASSPSVFVSVARLALEDVPGAGEFITVYMMGEVGQPGMIQVEPGTTLLQSLAQSGGFSPFAATKRIQLRRVDPQTGGYVSFKFNYRALENGAAITGRTVLADGDVIVVPQRRLFE